MTAVVVGATAGLGRALAAQLAAGGRSLLLVASDGRDLHALAQDLSLRHGVAVSTLELDAARHAELGPRLRAALGEQAPDVVLLPLGLSLDEDAVVLEPADAERIVGVNLLSVVAAVSALLPSMRERGRGDVIGFGSIAAARGRTRNAVYAAAKRGLQSYFESLRHAAEGDGIGVAFYVVGYLDTNLSYGKPLPLPAAAVGEVAARVVRGIGRVRGTRHLPPWWRLVSTLVRWAPWPVFRRMKA